MDIFVRKHQKKINGTLGCFDRMLFRGYLPIQAGWMMAELLKQNHISFWRLKDFLVSNADRIKEYAKTMAAKQGRPFQYLNSPTRKEDLARKMAEDEGIQRGARVKHRVKENWLKMYDKAGSVLRIEMVINNPEEFKVRKQVTRKKRQAMEWVPMRKGVAYLFRYREVSRQANDRYLDALAVVDAPTTAIQRLDEITTRKETKSGRGVRAFNPLSRDDILLFKAMMAGEHCIRGLSNADIRTCLEGSQHLRNLADNPKNKSAKVSRILNRFHTHKLIAKIPRTRRWRVTDHGRQIMAASLCLRDVAFPELFRKNIAA